MFTQIGLSHHSCLDDRLFIFPIRYLVYCRAAAQSLQPGQNLIGTSVTEAFSSKSKSALAAGVLFACPVIFYQIWRFIAPGLSKRERNGSSLLSCAPRCFLSADRCSAIASFCR